MKNRAAKTHENKETKCGTTAACTATWAWPWAWACAWAACCLFVRHSIVRSFVRLSSVCCT